MTIAGVLSGLTFDKLDLYILIAAFILSGVIWKTLTTFKQHVPTLASLQELATLTNTKGGIIILLVFMWFFTLILTTGIALWAIVHGVDPQNGILILLFGMLSSGAWGNVNGALFKTMTGEDPKPIPPSGMTIVQKDEKP